MSDIVVYGDPVLIKKAAKVDSFGEDLKELVHEMHKSMIKAQGIGLAAPQIGVSQQVAIVDTSVGEDPEALSVLINPEIIAAFGTQKGEEGCLSFPGIVTVIERPHYVKLRGLDLDGNPTELEGTGLVARAFCHEIDHLNGVLILDRVSPLKKNMIKKKVQKRVKAGTWAS